MTKKFILTMLVMVVFAGLALFAPNQAWAPPTTTADCLQCPDGDLAQTFFDEHGNITAAYWCPPDPGNNPDTCTCTAEGGFIQLSVSYSLYVCDSIEKNDCRLVQDTSLGAWCGFGRGGGWPYCVDQCGPSGLGADGICDDLQVCG